MKDQRKRLKDTVQQRLGEMEKQKQEETEPARERQGRRDLKRY